MKFQVTLKVTVEADHGLDALRLAMESLRPEVLDDPAADATATAFRVVTPKAKAPKYAEDLVCIFPKP